MRVALIEMLHPDAVPAERPIPPEGAIEEAVESAKTFCGADAPGFVNGVLGAVLREVRENAQIQMSSVRAPRGSDLATGARRRAAALGRALARRGGDDGRGLRVAGDPGGRGARAAGAHRGRRAGPGQDSLL